MLLFPSAFSPDAVANYFLSLAEDGGHVITPMKLQKLMFFAHGWHLALEKSGKPLVGEDVQAWEYGPVFPSTYHEFKDFGNQPIDRRAVRLKEDKGRLKFLYPSVKREAERKGLDLPFAEAVMDRIWEVYRKYPASTLSNMTHEKGSPWWTVREKAKEKYGGRIPQGLNIPNKTIRDWFKQQSRIPTPQKRIP